MWLEMKKKCVDGRVSKSFKGAVGKWKEKEACVFWGRGVENLRLIKPWLRSQNVSEHMLSGFFFFFFAALDHSFKQTVMNSAYVISLFMYLITDV